MNTSQGPNDLLPLHRRLLEGDRAATAEVLTLTVDPVALRATARCRCYGVQDEHLVHDAVIDAVLDYCARPHQFAPSAGLHLVAFLTLAAVRNALNTARAEGRRKYRERAAGSKRARRLELDAAKWHEQMEDLRKVDRHRQSLLDAMPALVDRAVLDLQFAGVRETAAFATVLGITDCPLAEQRRSIKRAKDRIRKTLQRRGLLPRGRRRG